MKYLDTKKKFWLYVFTRTMGNTLVITGIALTLIGIWPIADAQFRYYWDKIWYQEYKLAGDTTTKAGEGTTFAGIMATPPPIPITPVDTNFGIVIEKIGVNAPVIANVDSSDYNSYWSAMAKGAAHAAGTAYPGAKGGENNNVFIFAHSTLDILDYVKRYNAIFINLSKLEKGDRIVTFYKGRRFDYEVFDKRVVEAHDVSYLTEPSKDSILTLQTCDPPGTQLRRLIVTAKLIGSY